MVIFVSVISLFRDFITSAFFQKNNPSPHGGVDDGNDTPSKKMKWRKFIFQKKMWGVFRYMPLQNVASQCASVCFFLGGGGWPYLITELICKFRANFPWVGSPEIVFYKKFGKQIHEAKNVHDFNLRFQIHIWFPYIYIYTYVYIYIYI